MPSAQRKMKHRTGKGQRPHRLAIGDRWLILGDWFLVVGSGLWMKAGPCQARSTHNQQPITNNPVREAIWGIH
jgi:hypothetical protein